MLKSRNERAGAITGGRQKAKALKEQHPPQAQVRLQAPFGIASVQNFSGEHIDVDPVLQMSFF
jgi:hypothetical protein